MVVKYGKVIERSFLITYILLIVSIVNLLIVKKDPVVSDLLYIAIQSSSSIQVKIYYSYQSVVQQKHQKNDKPNFLSSQCINSCCYFLILYVIDFCCIIEFLGSSMHFEFEILKNTYVSCKPTKQFRDLQYYIRHFK